MLVTGLIGAYIFLLIEYLLGGCSFYIFSYWYYLFYFKSDLAVNYKLWVAGERGTLCSCAGSITVNPKITLCGSKKVKDEYFLN